MRKVIIVESRDFLKIPVDELELTDHCVRNCQYMGFSNLEDLLSITPAELINTPGFTYSWLGEIIEFLEAKGLLHLLQPNPGKRSG